MNDAAKAPGSVPRELDVVIVGAGFAGLYALHRMRGLGLAAHIFEAGSGVGGTWYWNRYPGARCDVESLEYSYQFDEELQQEWEWTERYSAQPEILKYINHVADRFDLRRDISFDTRIASAHFDEAANRWTVTTENGDTVSTRFCIMATGCLSTPNLPEIKGRDTFAGPIYHTGRWPHEEIDFTGKRVGIIGTGSSGIQSIPIIAEQADHLTVFQRTPNFSVPARNAPLNRELERKTKADYPAFRARNNEMPSAFGSRYGRSEELAVEATPEERRKRFEERYALGGLLFLGGYMDVGIEKEANDYAADFVREKIREIVEDPAKADMLIPDSAIGCKRLCADTGYFETFNRDNVTLVDVKADPIAEITPSGLKTQSGSSYEFDALVFATGFDAMTGSLLRIDIQGRNGQTLKEKWSAGPRTYLGLMTVGFPNLFMISGPGSPSVLTNMIPSIEQHVNWVADCLGDLQGRQMRVIEPQQAAEDEWVGHVNEVADATLLPTCNSWYLGANVPGKPRVFMPYLGFPEYVAKCEDVVAKDYDGFELGGA